MHCQVRKATHCDHAQIASLIQNELGYPDLQLASFTNRFSMMLASNEYETFVAAQNNKIIGFIGLQHCLAYKLEGNYLRITALAVSQKSKGKGIGTLLLQQAEAYARENHIVTLTLNSGLNRTGAHSFYRKTGTKPPVTGL